MTKDVHVLSPEATIEEAAKKMKDLNVGVLPICADDRLMGTITDRDIILRVVAQSSDCKTTTVKEAMSSPIVYCFENQDVEEAARVMEVKQIRRLVVLNENKRLVGIFSLGDLAVKTGREELSGEVLEKVSEPVRNQAAA